MTSFSGASPTSAGSPTLASPNQDPPMKIINETLIAKTPKFSRTEVRKISDLIQAIAVTMACTASKVQKKISKSPFMMTSNLKPKINHPSQSPMFAVTPTSTVSTTTNHPMISPTPPSGPSSIGTVRKITL